MATGVPSSNKESAINRSPVVLSYGGKSTEESVLISDGAMVSEVLRGHGVTGTIEGSNQLYFGDNDGVLPALLRMGHLRGAVRLVYIDPPYSTGTAFHSRSQTPAYRDVVSGGAYLESLRRKLIWLRELLAEDGSIYVHLDEKMVFHAKVLMDEIFGSGNYRNCITRKKCNPKNYTRRTFGNVSDFILFYSKSAEYVWNRPLEPWTEARIAKEYQNVDRDTGRRFKKVPIHAPGVRNGETGKLWRGMLPPPGKHWQYTPAKLDEFDARGEIYWSPNGNPRRKVFLDVDGGVSIQDIWLEFRDAHNQNVHITGYPTEKNPDLLRRIVGASSNEGDIVLDCFSGSGTTLAVASEMGRRWIGVDSSPEAIKTTLRRFRNGTARMGDFVSERRLHEPTAPTLFEIPSASEPHPPSLIDDFTLFATDDCLRSAHALAADAQMRGVEDSSADVPPSSAVV